MKKLLFIFLLALSLTCSAQVKRNFAITAIASATFTSSTFNSSAFTNETFRGAHFIVKVSAYTSGSYAVNIQGYNPTSDEWYTILAGSPIASNGDTVLKVYPGIGVVANGSASDFLPYIWRVQLIGASTPSMTISVGANLED